MGFLIKYFVVFGVSVITALLLVPLFKKLAPALRMVDEPDERRIHKQPIPRCGGIPLFLATHLGIACIFLGPWRNLAGSFQLADWGVLFTCSLILLCVGIADDRRHINAWIKLFGQLAVAAMMFFGGFSFEAFLGIKLPFIIDLLATLFWFALLINAFNLIDGMDGACAGLGMIAGAGLAGMLLSLHQPTDALVLVALAGACLGFLRYNFSPASVFLGDCGSMFIGFMLAAASLKANVKQSMVVALIIPMLAVGVPVFDVMLAVWRRLARKLISRLSHDGLATRVFGPDLDHIHHRLIRSGMTQRRAAIILYGAAIFICVIAIGTAAMSSNQTALLMIGMVIALHVIVRQVAHVELWTTTQVVLKGIRRPRSIVGIAVAMTWDLTCLVFATYFVYAIVLLKPFSWLHLAVNVTIPFATIYFYHVYRTVWTRSRASQLLVLVLQLAAGEALAYVALLWASNLNNDDLFLALLLHTTIAGTGIVGVRASLRVVRDLGAWLQGNFGADRDVRTLLLGAGENAILYLRQASFADQQKAPRKIVGMVDDNAALHSKSVYGYPVLGNFSELERIIEEKKINELIFTHHFGDQMRADILAIASERGLLVRDFVFVLRDLDEQGACRGIVKPYSVSELDCRNLCTRMQKGCTAAVERDTEQAPAGTGGPAPAAD